jgi:hypothetical protein
MKVQPSKCGCLSINMWVFNHQNMGIEPKYGGLTNGPKETMDLPGTAVSTVSCHFWEIRKTSQWTIVWLQLFAQLNNMNIGIFWESFESSPPALALPGKVKGHTTYFHKFDRFSKMDP